MKESKETRQKKMTEAFSYLDRAAFAFEKEGRKNTRKILYSHTQKVIDDLYLEYILKNETAPLSILEKVLYEKAYKDLSQNGIRNVNEKYVIYEVRKQAELEFDQEFERIFPRSSAQSNLKKFIDEYTTGFYILNQDNPEDFQQFYLESIAEFKACFYILMKDSLKNISDQTS